MNPLNDIPLNEHCLKLRRLTDKLPELLREGRVKDLQDTIDLIGEHWMKAGYALNDVRWPRMKTL